MDGVLIIDKPVGMTSHDVIAQVRRLLSVKRAGHTGTLDPFATGVLVVLIGRATRLAQFLSGAEKEYEAVIRLGYATDTGDITGNRVSHAAGEFSATAQDFGSDEIEAALASLRGEIEQMPPMYSAKKVAGQKLYELARRGEEVERKAIRVNVIKFAAEPRDGRLLKQNEDGTSDLAVRVACSAGTYVRSLAEVVGEKLGVGAHLSQLRRVRAGDFKITDTITLEQLSESRQSGLVEQMLISPDVALRHLPAIELSEDEVRHVHHGIDMQVAELQVWLDGAPVRMRDVSGNLIAVGTYNKGNRTLHPGVVISTQG